MSSSFTGRTRQRRTRWTVRASDTLARGLIVAGGIGTIVAVSLVCLFLVWVVLPLFWPGFERGWNWRPIESAGEFAPPWQGEEVSRKEVGGTPASKSDTPLRLAVNEQGLLGYALLADGELRTFRLDRAHAGELLESQRPFGEEQPMSAAFTLGDDRLVVGFDDGTVRIGAIDFRARPVRTDLSASDAARRAPKANGTALEARAGDSLFRFGAEGFEPRPSERRTRRYIVRAQFGPPLELAESAGLELLDVSWRDAGAAVCSYASDGRLRFSVLNARRDLETDDIVYKPRTVELPWPASAPREKPFRVFVGGVGNSVFVAWRDGRLARYDVAKLADPRLVEEVDLVGQRGVHVTAMAMMIGKATLIVGDSAGRVRGWFRINHAEDHRYEAASGSTTDGSRLVAAHEILGPSVAVTALAASPRGRTAALGYADGSLRLYYLTNERLLAETAPSQKQSAAITSLAMTPRGDGLLAASSAAVFPWRLDIPHPEVSPGALFLPVWYEGYPAPSHEWQSSGGTDDFEPKLGMTKLVFGTLKATFYSLLIGVPLALLAAVYTSEFLHKRVRARIKPTIELMASLPSVVLGFIAAMVLAPVIERALPAIIVGLVTVPLSLLLGAFLWQLLPTAGRARLGAWRFAGMCLALPLGVWAAQLLARPVEQWLFAGDLMAWLAGRVGDGTGGWMLLLVPLSALATAWLLASRVNPALRGPSRSWSASRAAWVELAKFVLATVFVLSAAWLASLGLSAAGLDPRGAYVGQYEQLNALVVGCVMGFAIIPIIYTLAEDALSTVPQHLRSASLGAGATPWQTATRIVIPTAMSGLFSAVMVGVGRAVGETMIVLMAAGNTPVLDWNIFNGFRTLSGNIAEELPEAVKDSTHYRTLFLAALVLFALTFILNTVAEQVRQRFRKRAYQM